MIRNIQSARKDADLQVSDRIRTVVTAPAAVIAALEANRELVAGETLTEQLELVIDDALETEQIAVAKLEEAAK